MRFSVLLLVLGLSGGALAVQPSAPDNRLDQKVTYQAKGETLHKVCEEISTKTGVVLRCGINQKDWEVRDRKVTLFVKDMPLREVQSNLASLLHFSWTSFDSKSVKCYRIIQTAKQRADEEALRQKSIQDEKDKQVKRRTDALADIESIASLKPADIAKLKDTDPWRYILATEPFGQAMANLIKTVPEVRAALANGEKCEIKLSTLSPEAQQSAKAFSEGSQQFFKKVFENVDMQDGHGDGGRAELEKMSSIPFDPATQTLTVNGNPSQMSYGPDPIIGEIGSETCPEGMPIIESRSPAGKIMGKALAGVMSGQIRVTGPEGRQIEEDMMKASLESQQDWFEKLPADDPDLDKVIKFQDPKPATPAVPDDPRKMTPEQAMAEMAARTDSKWFDEAAGKLAEKAELQVVADHLPSDHNVYDPRSQSWTPPTEGKLRDILEGMAKAANKQVKKTGKVVRFEDHQWFEKRSWEVPEDLLDYLRKAAETYKMSIDDAVTIAGLTDKQIQHTITPDPQLSGIGYDWGQENKSILLLYGTLSAAQKQALAGEGLSFSLLTPPQFATLLKAAADDESQFGRLMRTAGDDEAKKSQTYAQMLLRLTADDVTGSYVFVLADPAIKAPIPSTQPDVEQTDPEEGPDGPGEPEDPSTLYSWTISLPRPEPEPSEEENQGTPEGPQPPGANPPDAPPTPDSEE